MLESLFLTSTENHGLLSQETRKSTFLPVESLDALKEGHEFLLKGDVFTQDTTDMWIKYKTENKINHVKLRPHPHEFFLYFDI